MTHDVPVSPDTFTATLSGARQFDADALHNIGLRELVCLCERARPPGGRTYSGRVLMARVMDVQPSGEQQVTVSIGEPLQDDE